MLALQLFGAPFITVSIPNIGSERRELSCGLYTDPPHTLSYLSYLPENLPLITDPPLVGRHRTDREALA